MKAYTKEFITDSTDEILYKVRNDLNKVIDKRDIVWMNAKGDELRCPWPVFNPNGAIKVSREDHPDLWDLGIRVQRRAEAERQNSGNAIASFNARLNAKPNTLSATVRCNGLSRTKCPVIDQLAECLSVLGNAQKVSRELFDREEKARTADLMAEERRSVKEMDEERKTVIAVAKIRDDLEKAAAQAAKEKAEKAQKAVKDAFTGVKSPEGNGEPVTQAA